VTTYVCSNCGERNAPGTTFCVNCHAFLAWDEVAGESDVDTPPDATVIPTRPGPRSQRQQPDEYDVGTVLRPSPVTSAGPDQATVDDSASRLQVTAEQNAVTVPATGELIILPVRVMNTSTIVDGYGVEAPGAPAWLIVESDPVHLLPGTDQALPVRLRVNSTTLLPAQQVDVVLRVRSMTQVGAHQDVPIEVTVPIVDVPVQLRAEPRLLRVRDTDASRCTIMIDNSRSNRPMLLRFSGSDAEQAVRFDFDPPIVDVGPGASASVLLALTAAQPEPGQELTRQLTITANDGARTIETAVTLQQSTSVRAEDPPVALEAVPSLVRVRDTTTGWVRIVADNRRGKEWAHLELKASDPERAVRVTWSGPELHVPPGGTAQIEAQFDAPLPDAGSEVSRTITVIATDGRRTSDTTVTLLQARSASPMTTLALRLEPSIVRVQDADSATTQVLIDNQKGRSGVRIFLGGNDLERAVRFTFSPPVVDVPPGQVQVVGLRLDSWRPPPGQEWTRQLTVTASDGQSSVETSGSMVQASSRAAIELLGVRLDPSVLRLANRSEGRLAAVVDNRNGAQPIRISLRGDDPENIIRFTFTPAILDVAPGQVAASSVRVRAPRPPGGAEVTRPFTILATDGRSEAQATGSVIQSASSRRPIARALFTLLGGLAMILGAFRPWLAVSDVLGVEIDVRDMAGLFGIDDLADALGLQRAIVDLAAPLISAGLAVVGLGVLVMFGLTGRSGRLSRLSAMLAALVIIGVLITVAIAGGDGSPGSGALLALVGCIAGYIGGKLVKR
jgi:P pilus assembly chaperone PapD